MAASQSSVYEKFIILSADGQNRADIANAEFRVTSFDYYENITQECKDVESVDSFDFLDDEDREMGEEEVGDDGKAVEESDSGAMRSPKVVSPR